MHLIIGFSAVAQLEIWAPAVSSSLGEQSSILSQGIPLVQKSSRFMWIAALGRLRTVRSDSSWPTNRRRSGRIMESYWEAVPDSIGIFLCVTETDWQYNWTYGSSLL
jgi:hypothetical protein